MSQNGGGRYDPRIHCGCASRSVKRSLIGGTLRPLCTPFVAVLFPPRSIPPALFTLCWSEKNILPEEKGPNPTPSSLRSSFSITPFGGTCGSRPSSSVTLEPLARGLSISKLVSDRRIRKVGNILPTVSGSLVADLFVIPPPTPLVSFGMGGLFAPTFGGGWVEGPGVVRRGALV